jgi:hypothetical protein
MPVVVEGGSGDAPTSANSPTDISNKQPEQPAVSEEPATDLNRDLRNHLV